ncbi:MAG: peptide-methionine (S)-S-oxide reductase MsrA [Myxococcota bacterium]
MNRFIKPAVIVTLLLTAGCTQGSAAGQSSGTRAAGPPAADHAVAIFAGGCFWCMERPFEDLDGVYSVLSGYTGGHVDHVTYDQIGTSTTGHVEAVRVEYDPRQIAYERLLEVFFRNIDPSQNDGQFCDRGPQYRSAIFVKNRTERALAERAKRRIRAALQVPIATEVREAATFWIAEDYHQDFYKTHPVHYARYRAGCGRDQRLQAIWGRHVEH